MGWKKASELVARSACRLAVRYEGHDPHTVGAATCVAGNWAGDVVVSLFCCFLPAKSPLTAPGLLRAKDTPKVLLIASTVTPSGGSSRLGALDALQGRSLSLSFTRSSGYSFVPQRTYVLTQRQSSE